jgi:hypothetical protein
MASDTDAKLDKLLAGLGILTTDISKLTTRLDSVEAEMKKEDAAPAAVAAEPAASGSDAKLDKIMDHLTGLHAKHDALKTTCDSLCSKHDELGKRMDAVEEGMKAKEAANLEKAAEPTPPAVDAAKKDGEQTGTAETGAAEAALAAERKENGLARNDSAESAKLDAANERIAGLEKVLADINKRMPAAHTPEDRQKFTTVQHQWEKIAQAFGDSDGAPPALNGESLPDYMRRLAGKHKAHSRAWKDADLSKVDDSVLSIAVDQIRADAEVAAMTPAPTSDGVLTSRVFNDESTGRKIRRFYGDISVMMAPFSNPRRLVSKFMTPGTRQ